MNSQFCQPQIHLKTGALFVIISLVGEGSVIGVRSIFSNYTLVKMSVVVLILVVFSFNMLLKMIFNCCIDSIVVM